MCLFIYPMNHCGKPYLALLTTSISANFNYNYMNPNHDKMKWSTFHSGQNDMVISFWQKWNGHFILAKMRWPFHSGQNEMRCISFRPKWDVHFGHIEMEFISFRPEWNGHVISAEMKCHFFDSLKKYATRTTTTTRTSAITSNNSI